MSDNAEKDAKIQSDAEKKYLEMYGKNPPTNTTNKTEIQKGVDNASARIKIYLGDAGVSGVSDNILNFLAKTAADKVIPGLSTEEQLSIFKNVATNYAHQKAQETAFDNFSDSYIKPYISKTEVDKVARANEAAGYNTQEAYNLAINDVADKIKQTQAAESKQVTNENAVQSTISNFPNEAAKSRQALSDELAKYQGEQFTKYMQPAIYQGMARRGLMGEQGALNQALANATENLASQREATIAPMARQDTLTAQQLDYENKLRQAQTAGMQNTDLTNYYRNLMAGGQQNAYAASQNQLSQAFQQALQNQQINAQQDYYNKQLEAQNQSSLGGVYGKGLSTLLGGVLGGVPGLLMGLTGAYVPGKYNNYGVAPKG